MNDYSTLELTLRDILRVISPLEEDWAKRFQFINELRAIVESVESLRGATVEPYGSFVSNLFTRWGDLDISIELPNGSFISSAGKKLKQTLLGDLQKALRRRGGWYKLQFIANARVPILKFESNYLNISCDVSINNLNGQMKSKLLFWINEIDGRFRNMVLLVKEWAKTHGINDSKSGTLNSYCLSMLIIFHFQTCVPPLLPPLKEIYPGNIVDDLIGVRAVAERHIEEICAENINKFSICNLTCLKELSISGCNVSHLPCEIGRLISLTHLDLEGNNLCTLPDSISNLTCLEELSMANCNLSDLPSEIWRLNSLQYWNLSGNGLRTLPDGINNLTHLGYLNLDKSAKLRSLPKLPASLDRLNASDCASLENIESEGLVGKTMILHGCHKLVENKFANNFIEVFTKHKEFSALKSSSEIILSGGEVPRWFQYQSAGSYLSFMVPPLINQKILGLIVCIVFFGSKEKCNDSSCLHYDIRNKNIVFLPDQSYHVQYQFIFEDQMWLKLLPQSCLEMQLEGGDEAEISIIVDEPIQVKKCGVNLVYEVDENVTKTNDEASTQYTSSPYQSVILEEAEVGSTN